MTEKVGHIKNPLTVISVFAGIAEISGTAVLPFIDIQNQATYIWFLMLFPPFLVGTFFATLNWNHKTLYAPSDYKNEEHFVNPLGKSTSQERVTKLKEEVEEVVSDIPITTKPDPTTSTITTEPSVSPEISPALAQGDEAHAVTSENLLAMPTHTEPEPIADKTIPSHTEPNFSPPQIKHHISASASPFERNRLTADIKLTEALAIKRISKLTGLQFFTGAKFLTSSGTPVLFDAASVSNNHLNILEVKLFRSNRFSPNRVFKILKDCEDIVRDKNFKLRGLTLYLVIVTEVEGIEQQNLHEKILMQVQQFDIDVHVHVVSMNELESEFPE